ncbi:MAG: hypothetical protein WA674_15480, partial [Candidatus Acidiferrales bacterium]
SQAILVATYTLAIAEETSNYVRSPMSVVIATQRGIFEEPPGDVEAVTDRLKQFERQVNQVFLSCSDVTTSSMNLKAQLEEFLRSAVALHEVHVEAEVRRRFSTNADYGETHTRSFRKVSA